MHATILVLALAAALQEPKEPETILQRMGDLRWQHGAYITTIAVLPGDKHALSSAYTGAVLWDLETGAAVRSYQGHKGMVFSMALFPDGRRFVTCGGDKRVVLWDIESTTPVRSFEGHKDAVRTVAVTSDGSRIVSGGHDAQVIVWDPASEKPLQVIASPLGASVGVAMQPGGRLALVDGPYKAALIDIDSGKVIKELALTAPDPRTKKGRGMEKVAFTPDGRHALAYFPYQGVTVWNVESGKEIRVLGTKGFSYSAVHFTRDGREVLLGSQKSLEVWDFEKGELIKKVGGSGFYAMAETEKGSRLVATDGGGSVAIWDLTTGKRLTDAGPGEVFCVAYSPDGRSLLAGMKDGSITLWDVAAGRTIRTFEKLSEKKFGDGSPTHNWAASLAMCPDGTQAVTAHWDGRTALWDLSNGKLIREYDGMFGGSVQGVALSPDGRWGAGSGHPAAIWDLEGGQAKRSVNPGPGAYTAVAFSPNGALLLLGSNSAKLRLFDATSGAQVREFEGHPGRVAALAFTPDGRHAVSGSESGEPFQLWDASTGKPVRTFAFPRGTPPSWGTALALSPDGRFLYSRGAANELVVWNVESGAIVKSFSGHHNTVKAIALSAGGRFVATGSMDTLVIHRHPGLPFKAKSKAWADAMRKDGEQLERGWKRFMEAVRSQDYDLWTEAMERGVALGDTLLAPLFDELRLPNEPIRSEEGEALLKQLDQDDVEARDKARKSLSDLGESAYGWARHRANDPALSGAARGALKSFCREIEALPVKDLEMKDIGELRAVLILIEQAESEKRLQALERFARGPMNSVPSRLARRYIDHVLRR
ncbi:MAG TPA: WD40 repeat domain-containing protein [Planctomycetota bacterium]|nr:WD40 repeat domain-containing protein [Planctomycetota bacterium]